MHSQSRCLAPRRGCMALGSPAATGWTTRAAFACVRRGHRPCRRHLASICVRSCVTRAGQPSSTCPSPPARRGRRRWLSRPLSLPLAAPSPPRSLPPASHRSRMRSVAAWSFCGRWFAGGSTMRALLPLNCPSNTGPRRQAQRARHLSRRAPERPRLQSWRTLALRSHSVCSGASSGGRRSAGAPAYGARPATAPSSATGTAIRWALRWSARQIRSTALSRSSTPVLSTRS